MSTILILDDDAADTTLIRRAAADADYTVLTSQDIDEFCLQMVHQRVDLVVVSLATITEQDTPRFESILGQFPDTKVLAVAPAQREGGLTTLLRAESLQARHLLAKPIDPQQLCTILNSTLPQPTQQD